MNRKSILPGIALMSVLVLCPAVHAAGEEAAAPAVEKVDAVPSAEAAIAELTKAYSKLEGYIASYKAEGKEKSFEATLGFDKTAGIFACDILIRRDGKTTNSRKWTDGGDKFFIENGEGLSFLNGYRAETDALMDLGKAIMTVPVKIPLGGVRSFFPGILITEEGAGFTSSRPTPWIEMVKGATVESADASSVTFLTRESGKLVIDRANGMLSRQVFTRQSGEVLTLERTGLRENPGKDAVRGISAEWPREGAKERPSLESRIPARLEMFQAIIDTAEMGQVDLGKLEKQLENRNSPSRRFARLCMLKGKGTLSEGDAWNAVLDRDKLRQGWLKSLPPGAARDEKSFEKFLGSEALKKSLMKNFAAGFSKDPGAQKLFLAEICGRDGWDQLKANDGDGKAARQLLGDVLARAYLEEILERKMEEQFGPGKGLD